MSANPWRGEVVLTIDDVDYTLRPTFSALCRIEQQLHNGLPVLAAKLADGMMTLEELAVIIRCCLCDEVPENLEDAIVQNGLAHVADRVAAMLSMVFGGCDES